MRKKFLDLEQFLTQWESKKTQKTMNLLCCSCLSSVYSVEDNKFRCSNKKCRKYHFVLNNIVFKEKKNK